MRLLKILSVVSLTILASVSFISASYSKDSITLQNHEETYRIITYEGQRIIECKDTKIKIPQFFSLSHSNIFIHISDDHCSDRYFEMTVDIGSDCYRAHICNQYAFSRAHITIAPSGGKTVDSRDDGTPTLGQAIAYGMKTVVLDKEITGYVISSQLYAYPTPIQLVWTDGSYVYTIKGKVRDENELIKSANSLINDSGRSDTTR